MVEFRYFPGTSDGKKSACNAGDLDDNLGLTRGLGRFLAEGNGILLQYSCLKNPMDKDGGTEEFCELHPSMSTKSWT